MIKKNSLRHLRTRWIFLLLTGFLLSGAICCSHNKPPTVVLIGEARAVGTIIDGTVTFEPGENQAGSYIIVTKAFFLQATWATKEVVVLRKEIERLRKIIEAGDPR